MTDRGKPGRSGDRERGEFTRASLEALQRVLDSLPMHIFWKDTDSVYLGCNRDFARVAGIDSPDEIVGMSDFDLAWKPGDA